MNLNINKWEYFDYVKIFDIRKGFYNKKPDPSGVGDIFFIGATDHNNGVTEKYTIDEISNASKTGYLPNDVLDKKLFPANAVCVTNNGSVGYAYYQDKPFTCSHDVNPLYLKNGSFNMYTGLFIATVIMHDKYRWGYGRKWRPERMIKSKIKLPIKYNKSGTPFIDEKRTYSEYGYVPDWEFMEEYIKLLRHKPIKTKILGKNTSDFNKNIETIKWKKFLIKNLFNISLSKGDIIAEDMATGPIPLVSSGESNNGIVAYIDSEGDGKAEIFDGNILTVDMFCNAFYQKERFYAVSHGRVNILIPKFNMNQYTGLFIAALINKEKYKFSYGRAVYSTVIANMEIKLPIKELNNKPIIDDTNEFSDEGFIPNWELMENYIKSLQFSDRI